MNVKLEWTPLETKRNVGIITLVAAITALLVPMLIFILLFVIALYNLFTYALAKKKEKEEQQTADKIIQLADEIKKQNPEIAIDQALDSQATK